MKRNFTVLTAAILAATSVPVGAINNHNANINRIDGADRYETSMAISSKSFKSADTAIIASGENFADALSGS